MVDFRSLLGLDFQLFSYQSANDIETKNRELMQQIKDHDPSYKPDLCISVHRGGHYAIRIALDHYFPELVENKNFHMICLSSYTGIAKTSKLNLSRGIPRDVSVLGEHVILVEDLSDKGFSFVKELHHIYSKTLDEVRRTIKPLKSEVDGETYEFYEREVDRLSNRLKELEESLSIENEGERAKAVTEIMQTGIRSEFENYVHVITAAAYIKPWTVFVPDFYIEIIPAWIVNSYEEQEVVKTIINNGELTLRQRRQTLLRTGISPRRINRYLKNLDREEFNKTKQHDPRYRKLGRREYLECPILRGVNNLQLSITKFKASRKFKKEHPDSS